jgi:hypothetical protein
MKLEVYCTSFHNLYGNSVGNDVGGRKWQFLETLKPLVFFSFFEYSGRVSPGILIMVHQATYITHILSKDLLFATNCSMAIRE